MTDAEFIALLPARQRAQAAFYLKVQRDYVAALTLAQVVDDALQDPRYDNPDEVRAQLRDLIDHGDITTRRIDLPDVLQSWPEGTFSGGLGHQGLCSAVATWLDAQGRPWTADVLACRTGSGVADLRTVDGELLVEVGHTCARKLIAYLDEHHTVLVVSYVTCGRFGVLLASSTPDPFGAPPVGGVAP